MEKTTEENRAEVKPAPVQAEPRPNFGADSRTGAAQPAQPNFIASGPQANFIPVPPREPSENVKIIRRVCGYVTIVATAFFAFIAILSIWLDISGDVLWRAFASLIVVGFGALIVAAVAPMVDKK